MALTTLITGRMPAPTDRPFGAAELEFTLSDWDRAGPDIFPPARARTPERDQACPCCRPDIFPPARARTALLATDGTIPAGFALWRNSEGERATTYIVTARWTEDDQRTGKVRREARLGEVSLFGPGPVNLADLLPLPAPVPDVPDALAQALAAAASAQAAALSTIPVLVDRIAAEAAAARSESARDAALGAAGWDQTVPDEAARLALTGLPANWRVYQIAPEPGRVWRWTGAAWMDTGPNPLATKAEQADLASVASNTSALRKALLTSVANYGPAALSATGDIGGGWGTGIRWQTPGNGVLPRGIVRSITVMLGAAHNNHRTLHLILGQASGNQMTPRAIGAGQSGPSRQVAQV